MDDTGRNYILVATALITLAGAYKHYSNVEKSAAAPSKVVTEAAASARCDQNAIQLGRLRMGCNLGEHGDARVRDITATETGEFTRGGAKVISLTGTSGG